MFLFINNYPVAVCLTVIVALLITEALISQFGQRASEFIAKFNLITAVLAGITIVMALAVLQSRLNLGWSVLLSMIAGSFLGIILYAVYATIGFLWKYLTYDIFHPKGRKS